MVELSGPPQCSSQMFPQNHPSSAGRHASPQTPMLPCLPRRQGHRLVHPPPPSPLTTVCYERIHPSDLLYFDIKKLARIVRTGYRITGAPQHDYVGGAGWEYLHIAVDDITWLAFAKPLPDESATCAYTFLHAILALIASHVVNLLRQRLLLPLSRHARRRRLPRSQSSIHHASY